MANIPIPNLPLAISLSGAEEVEIVQAGSSYRTTTGAIAAVNDAESVLFPPNGGTGQVSLTPHAVLIGEGASPVATAAPGLAGSVLVSNGPSADPSFQELPVSLFIFPPLSSAPLSPSQGQAYFDTSLGYPLIWNGAAWVGFLLS